MDDEYEPTRSTAELLARALADERTRPQIQAKMQRLLDD
jgi:hypothetical protein